MADKAIFEIIVTNKGLKINQKGVDDLGASVERTGKKTKSADNAYKDFNDTQKKGVIGTANSTKSFSKLAQTIGDGGGGLVSAYAGLAANAFAVSAAFNVLNSAAQSQSMLEGLIVQGEKAGKTLTVLSGRLKEITRDTISTTEAMQAVTLGASAGISSADLEKITEVATNASLALGRSVPDSLNRMTLAITKMEPELVDELGLTTKITEASERYARQNNITVASMTQAQKQQALLNSWVEQGTLKYEGLKEAVDPNPYEKLAATFRDLVTDGLKIINVLLKPLILFLGESKLALLALSTVFLSSIKSQILPGITQVSRTALKEAENAREASIDALKNEKGLAGGRRKAINEFIAASKEGIATQKQFDDAIAESRARLEAAEKRKTPLKPETLSRITKEEIDRQDKLKEIQLQSAKANIAQAQAMGYAASEGVTLTNVKTKLKDTSLALGNSFMATYNSTKTTKKGLTGLATNAKAAANGIAAAGKVAAVGFLNFLPVIGQAIAIITILYEVVGRAVFEKLTGRTEEVTKALDAFNEVVDSTKGKLEAFNKIQLSTAPASSRATAAISNQMSTVYELAEAYTAVAKAVEARAEAEKKDTADSAQRRALFDELIAAREAGDQAAIKSVQERMDAEQAASRLGIEASSKAARAFASQRGEMFMDDEYIAAAQALEKLEKVMPGVADNFYAINGGVDQFDSLDPDKKVKLVNDQLIKTAEVTRVVDTAFKSLNESITTLNNGYIDFIKSLQPTTPFDSIVNQLQSVQKNISDTERSIKDLIDVGGDTGSLQEAQAATLTGISGSSRNIFSGETRAALEYFDTIDTNVQRARNQLQAMDESQAGYAEKQAEINRLEGQRKSVLSSTSVLVTRGIADYEKLVSVAQIEAITRQGTLAIAQAYLQNLQKQGQVTAEDVEKQMRAENAIIELQAAQLDAQIAILKVDLDREQSALRLIKSNREMLEGLSAQRDILRGLAVEAQIFGAYQSLNSLNGRTDTESIEQRLIAEAKLSSLERAKVDLAEETTRAREEEEAVARSIAQKEANISNLIKQARAIRAGANTEAEILNAKLKKAVENEKQLFDIRHVTQELEAQRAANEREVVALSNRYKSSILDQNQALIAQSYLRQQALTEEFVTRRKILEADIELARVRGNSSQVEFYTELLEVEESRYNANKDLLNSELSKSSIQLASIKNIEEEVSLKRASLEITQRTLDAQREESLAIAENTRAGRELLRKRSGAGDTEANRQREQIKAAEEAYEIALKESETKIALIELEFMLLEAKRKFMISDLGQRARVLTEKSIEARRNEPVVPPQIDEQGNITVSRVKPLSEKLNEDATLLSQLATDLEAQSGTYAEAETAAISTVLTNLDTLSKKVDIAKERGLRATGGFVELFNSMKDTADLGRDRGDTDVGIVTDLASTYFDTLKTQLSELGPEGEIVSAVVSSALNISNSFQDAFKVIGDASSTTEERISAGLQALSSIISGVMSILAASSNARIANIDREIAAEQKRDGKSAQSLAAIEAMEKKKDSIARKQFNTNKKLMMAQAVIGTAAGIAGALGSMPGIPGIILAGIIGAMGAAQLAIIAGTQYESTSSVKAATPPSTLSIGRRGDSVDLARGPSANAGGEAGFLRGSQGTGSNANNFRTIGSAYGGELMRGYGNRGFVVGEKGPEVITPETPINVTPANDVMPSQPLNATFNIQALDASGVEELLVAQKGNIISMLRSAANASGQGFMEDVNTNIYTRPSVNKL